MPSLLRKKILITMGDPAGIGPEVVIKSLRKSGRETKKRLTIIGSLKILQKYGLPKNFPGKIIDIPYQGPLKPGHKTLQGAKASIAYLKRAVETLKKEQAGALVTAPICKETIGSFLKDFRGHTEYLAEAFHVKKFDMLFVGEKLKTLVVTRHIPLCGVSKQINAQKVFQAISFLNATLKNTFKIKKPRIAVCGINPHAGENGTIGKDEQKKIIPAIRKAQRQRISVSGPFAADTLFAPKNSKNYDAIIAMYHDQGLIPVKALYFEKVVNMTTGLPFIRTSPAHGTAFDIAGQNRADPSSMREAIQLATRLTS